MSDIAIGYCQHCGASCQGALYYAQGSGPYCSDECRSAAVVAQSTCRTLGCEDGVRAHDAVSAALDGSRDGIANLAAALGVTPDRPAEAVTAHLEAEPPPTLDLDAAYPMPEPTFSGQPLRDWLIDRADVAYRLALRASNPLARHYYLGVARGTRDAIAEQGGIA
jgi:hypothetical protein